MEAQKTLEEAMGKRAEEDLRQADPSFRRSLFLALARHLLESGQGRDLRAGASPVFAVVEDPTLERVRTPRFCRILSCEALLTGLERMGKLRALDDRPVAAKEFIGRIPKEKRDLVRA